MKTTTAFAAAIFAAGLGTAQAGDWSQLVAAAGLTPAEARGMSLTEIHAYKINRESAGDDHAGVDDLRRAELALDHDGAPARAERHLHGLRQGVHAAADAVACIFPEQKFLGRHDCNELPEQSWVILRWGCRGPFALDQLRIRTPRASCEHETQQEEAMPRRPFEFRFAGMPASRAAEAAARRRMRALEMAYPSVLDWQLQVEVPLACAADGTVFRNPERVQPKRDVGKALSKFRELIKDKENTALVFEIYEALPSKSFLPRARAATLSEQGQALREAEPFLPPMLDDHAELRKLPAGSVALPAPPSAPSVSAASAEMPGMSLRAAASDSAYS